MRSALGKRRRSPGPRQRILAVLLGGGLGAAVLAIPGAADPRSERSPGATAILGGVQLPASYTASLPCDSCPGREYLLNLLPNGIFYRRLTIRGNGSAAKAERDEIGVWEVASGGDTLLLHPTLGPPARLALGDGGRLRLVAEPVVGLEPGPDRVLTRALDFQPIEPRLFLRGKYARLEQGGVFRECVTGRRLRVAPEGEAAALDSAYLAVRKQYGEDLLASLEGRLVRRSGPDGGERDYLVVERFGHFWPREVCGRWLSLARVEDSYWYLMRLGGKPFLTPLDAHEPFLRLDSASGRVEGSTGCKAVSGSFRLEGERLRFEHLRFLGSECAGRKEQERAIEETLRATVGWRLRAGLLELYDADGEMLAWFEPRFGK